MQIITTARLRLFPFSLELKKAIIADKTKFAEMLDLHVPQHWPEPAYDDNISSIKVLEKIGMRQLSPEGNMLKWMLR